MKTLLFVAMLASIVLPAHAELPPLIPRDVLFGAAENLSPSVSPHGTRLAWLAPDSNKVLQIWLRTLSTSLPGRPPW